MAVYETHRDRWFIENNAIKELCRYWALEHLHWTRFNAIRAHIMYTVVMFNLHVLFKSKYGRKFSEKSIEMKRAPGFRPPKVIVYCDNYFGIFDIEEYTVLIAPRGPP